MTEAREAVLRGSLSKDQATKAGIYARARIPEYWIVDVAKRTVQIFLDADARYRRYRRCRTLAGSEILRSSRLPGPSLTVRSLFE